VDFEAITEEANPPGDDVEKPDTDPNPKPEGAGGGATGGLE